MDEKKENNKEFDLAKFIKRSGIKIDHFLYLYSCFNYGFNVIIFQIFITLTLLH